MKQISAKTEKTSNDTLTNRSFSAPFEVAGFTGESPEKVKSINGFCGTEQHIPTHSVMMVFKFRF